MLCNRALGFDKKENRLGAWFSFFCLVERSGGEARSRCDWWLSADGDCEVAVGIEKVKDGASVEVLGVDAQGASAVEVRGDVVDKERLVGL